MNYPDTLDYTLVRDQFGLAPGDSVGVIVAHPDDEAYLTSRLIEVLHASDVIVHAITATNGEASTKGDPSFVHAGKRPHESAQVYALLGIPPEQQHYLGLPDGELHLDHWQRALASRVGAIAVKNDIGHLFTLGADGFDGHTDHISTHKAALEVQRMLRITGKELSVWQLSSDGEGDVVLPVVPERKLAIVALHGQFDLWPITETRPATELASLTYFVHGYLMSQQTRDDTRRYDPLLQQESYVRVMPTTENSVSMSYQEHNSIGAMQPDGKVA